MYDSVLVQYMSVVFFAEALGFVYVDKQHSFKKHTKARGWTYYKFSELQCFHNSMEAIYPHLSSYCDYFDINSRDYLRNASGKRIVEASQVQWDRKSKLFSSNKKQVRFIDSTPFCRGL